MNKNRLAELLAYASVCFRHGTSPFETTHLTKKSVTADECKELSQKISDILDESIDFIAVTNALSNHGKLLGRDLRANAEKEYAETQ